MKRQGIIGPLILITVGSILLFNNLGLLSWGIWTALWHFWPVILILIGLDIIVSRTESKVYYILGVLTGLIIIFGVLVLAWNYPVINSEDNTWDLTEVLLIGKDLNGANLEGKDMREAFLIGANMNNANLYNANLENALLIGANMNGANLSKANMKDSSLIGANLNGANLSEAILIDANLIGANINGANLCKADIEGANIMGVETTDSTICSDCTMGPCW